MPSALEDYSCLWTFVRNNNEKALYQLYQHQYDELYRYGLRISTDTALVKDSINSLFTEIWQKRNTLPQPDNVKGYIFIWFKRKLYKQLKQKNAGKLFDEIIPGYFEPAEKSFEETLIDIEYNEQRKEKIRRALESLSPRQRELIRLRFFEDMSFEEIAIKTNTSLRTVYNTLHTAINRLKTAFQSAGISLLLIPALSYFLKNFQ